MLRLVPAATVPGYQDLCNTERGVLFFTLELAHSISKVE